MFTLGKLANGDRHAALVLIAGEIGAVRLPGQPLGGYDQVLDVLAAAGAASYSFGRQDEPFGRGGGSIDIGQGFEQRWRNASNDLNRVYAAVAQAIELPLQFSNRKHSCQ